MRLTLRTLLAYLDDLLKPADAREIGRRLTGDSPGAGMAGRIRDVLRRRRIGTPAVDGDPDANVVAEYLDNLLPDADVEAHERACLASDEKLAETAACHQILTLVMGKPIRVSANLRERAYALGVPAEVETTAEHVEADVEVMLAPRLRAEADENAGREPAAIWSASVAKSEKDELPEFLARAKQRPSMSWAVGLAVLIVGTCLFVVLIRTDDAYRRRPGQSVAVLDEVNKGRRGAVDQIDELAEGNQPNVAVVGVEASQSTADAVVDPAETKPAVVEPATVAATTVEPDDQSTTAVAATTPMTESPAGDTTVADTQTAGAATVEPTSPETMVAKAGTEPGGTPAGVEPAETTVPTSEPAAPAVPPLPAFKWTQRGESFSLHVSDVFNDWAVLGAMGELNAGEQIIVPEPFEADLLIDDGPADVRMLPGTDLVVTKPTPELRGGLSIRTGRVVVTSNVTTDDADSKPEHLLLSVEVGDDRALVELGAGAQFAVEAITTVPDQILEGSTMPRQGMLYVTRGPVTVMRDGDENSITDSSEAAGAAVETVDPMQPRVFRMDNLTEATALNEPPSWTSVSEPSSLARRHMALFEKLIPLDRAVVNDMKAIIKEPTYRTSELAAALLSQLGEAQPLVEALTSQHEETRLQAIRGLRRWLAEDPTRLDSLNEMVGTLYRPEDAPEIARLLVGFEKESLADPEISAELLNGMASGEIAVRELAFFHVKKFTGKTFSYRPNANQSSRDVALRRWSDAVERDGALLSLEAAPVEAVEPDAAEAPAEPSPESEPTAETM